MNKLITQIKRVALALCLATPIVSWADGNVAKIGETEYETVQAALAAYQPGDVIELVATPGETKVFNRAGTFKFKLDMTYAGWFNTVGCASGYKLDGTYQNDETTVWWTVVADSGVAKLIHADESFQWYSSVRDAYGYASATDQLVIKLDGDFSTSTELGNGELPTVASITFETETEDPIVVTAYHTPGSGVYYYMSAATWVAPANVTLKLYTQTVTSINAGTLEVPSEATITLPNFGGGITLDSLKGEGRLACLGRVTNDSLNSLLRNTNWKGTMQMGGFDYLGGDIALKLWGNENSTVCFNNADLKFINTYNSLNGVKALEIGPGGLGLKGAYNSDSTIVISAKITGSGTLTFGTTGSLTTYNFTGDFSEFAGNLTMTTDSNTRVYIGNGCVGNGKCISIANGATATVAAGKSWTAQGGFVVLGTLNVAGSLINGTTKANNQIYGAQTTGKIVYKNAAAICTVGGSYKGEIVIESIAAGGTATEVPLNFGCSDAKLTLEGVTGNAWCAGSDYTVQPEVTLAGNVNFQNGSSGKAVTFRKIAAGTGNLSLKTWNGIGANTGTGITYGFTTLDADKYTGTIQLDASQNSYHLNPALTFNVGDILKAGAKAGDRVLPLTTTGAVLVNLTNAKVNGEAANLVFDANGEDGSGIYIAAAGFDGGDGNTFTIDSAMQTTLNAWLPPAATLSTVKFEDTGLTYAQGYALGLFDYDKGIIENVKVTIDVVGGKVRLGLNSTPVDGYVVTLKVFEKTSLDDNWPTEAVSYSIGADITPASEEAGFYKVGISIADAVAE